MFTGTAEELKAAERRAHRLAEQVAELLTELEKLGPVFFPGQGRIGVFGCAITKRQNRWTAES